MSIEQFTRVFTRTLELVDGVVKSPAPDYAEYLRICGKAETLGVSAADVLAEVVMDYMKITGQWEV